ncbi:MAG: DUF4301 family protein [Bacteroidales bacterium]
MKRYVQTTIIGGSSMFSKSDLAQFAKKNISVEKIEKQLHFFKVGFPYIDVLSAATPEKGILVLSDSQKTDALNIYNNRKCKLTKFIPASGVASRMFKDLYNSLDQMEMNGTVSADSKGSQFVSHISEFAFYNNEMFEGCSDKEIIERVLTEKGLSYGAKPKGQLLFHKYYEEVRTAFEEHLVEGALYAKSPDNTVEMVVSVSAEHLDSFKNLFESIRKKYESRYGVKYNVYFTLQSQSTDTIAGTFEGEPFRKADGSLLFRPGGHGALIENINEINSDILIIKNIDNVVKEDFIEQTILWKQILIGKLLMSMSKTFNYIKKLDSELAIGDFDRIRNICSEISKYLEEEYYIKLFNVNKEEMPLVLRKKLNRPIRVCGMVKNLGEPGGGPFIVRDKDGSTSLQILESAQLNPSNPLTAGLLASSTHFNPVDLVCLITDYSGKKFNLNDFVDESAGFITSKSSEGKVLLAQELPGLWNGAMSNWNTIFVEVPLITFNPVKTVMDLLRKEHKG